MDDSKLRIIQSYEQGLAPAGSDKRGPTVTVNAVTSSSSCVKLGFRNLNYIVLCTV